jgi:hypothetical protein
MRTIIAILILSVLSVLCGCALFKEPATDTNPEVRFKEQRIEIVAKSLISEGKAKDMAEARPLAEKLVEREISDQKGAARENEEESKLYEHNRNTRVDDK